MRSVAIIGAGPGGLIAARKLLQSGNFTVTVFERSSQVGGVWVENGPINPDMRTNLAHFTVAFSDLSWNSIDLGGNPLPMYPKASQVLQYLETYYDRYIPRDTVRFNTSVEGIERISEGDRSVPGPSWRLTLAPFGESSNTNNEETIFDHLILAPGFASNPHVPQYEIAGNLSRRPQVPVLHSTEYRNLSQILFHNGNEKKKKVLVVGGSHSGSDIATLVAHQLFDARYTPHANPFRHLSERYEVVHLTTHEMYAIPPFVRDGDGDACRFQPLDFITCDRSGREQPILFTYGLTGSEQSNVVRTTVKQLIQGGSDLAGLGQENDAAPYGVNGETYHQYVRSGAITQLLGTLERLERLEDDLLATARTTRSEAELRIEDVAAVIYCTGFDVTPSLSILPPDVRSEMGYDPSCRSVPIILNAGYLSANANVPGLAVIGYPGSKWGHFEMQARSAVRHFETMTASRQSDESSRLEAYMRDLKVAIKARRKDVVPQNPFGDYAGLMEQAARELGLEMRCSTSTSIDGFVFPARYTDPGTGSIEASKTMAHLEYINREIVNAGLFAARAVFHGLLGSWASHEKPPVCFQFHPRFPTHPKYDSEYLSVETAGEDRMRRVWRYEEASDEITLWSVSPLDELTTEKRIFSLGFIPPGQVQSADTAVAMTLPAELECAVVTQLQEYWFEFKGALVQAFSWGQNGSMERRHFVRPKGGWRL